MAGHRAGAEALRRVVEAARIWEFGILTRLCVFFRQLAPSAAEVSALMKLFHIYLRREQHRCLENGVRVSQSSAGATVCRACCCRPSRSAKRPPRAASGCICGWPWIIRRAMLSLARRADAQGPASRARSLTAALGAPDVDLLIRTGGEQRLSDFLLWECAYAELVFTP